MFECCKTVWKLAKMMTTLTAALTFISHMDDMRLLLRVVAIQMVQNNDNKVTLPVRFVTRVGYRVATYIHISQKITIQYSQ